MCWTPLRSDSFCTHLLEHMAASHRKIAQMDPLQWWMDGRQGACMRTASIIHLLCFCAGLCWQASALFTCGDLEISLEVCTALGVDACLGNALTSIYNGQCPLRLRGLRTKALLWLVSRIKLVAETFPEMWFFFFFFLISGSGQATLFNQFWWENQMQWLVIFERPADISAGCRSAGLHLLSVLGLNLSKSSKWNPSRPRISREVLHNPASLMLCSWLRTKRTSQFCQEVPRHASTPNSILCASFHAQISCCTVPLWHRYSWEEIFF